MSEPRWPSGASEQAVIAVARSRSVGLYGMSAYRASHRPDPPQLVLGFGNTSQRAIRAGIAVLGVAASSQLPEHYPQAD